MKNEVFTGRLQTKSELFGFLIPDDRDYYGGDFFVSKKHFNGAKDGSKVEAEQLEKSTGKKPEARILKVITGKNDIQKPKVLRVIEGIYSGGKGNFGFIDIEGQEKGLFVYGNNKKGAQDGDKVKAEVIDFKDKEEAIVIEVFGQDEEILVGEYRDNDRFGFVLPDDKSGDIFIAGSRKGEAQEGDMVEVKIIKRGGKNPEGVIVKVL